MAKTFEEKLADARAARPNEVRPKPTQKQQQEDTQRLTVTMIAYEKKGGKKS